MVEANEPWLGIVPSDWKRSRIRNEAILSPGFSSAPPMATEMCTVVPMESLSTDGVIDSSNQQSFGEIPTGLPLFEQGDVLFAKITPCMENGKGAFVPQLPTRYSFGSTEYHVLRPRPGIDGRFLYHATFNPIFRAYAAENMTGAAGQKRVASRFLKDTRLFLPPLPEQQRIAAYLDASCAAIDAAVAAKRRQLEILDALRRDALQDEFTKRKDCPVERIKDVTSKITSGVTPEGGAANYLDAGVPLLRSQNVHFDGLRLDDVAYISAETHADMAGSQLQPKDVLLNITGASIGRCSFVPIGFGEGNVNQHVCIIRPNHQIDYRYLAAFLSSPTGQDQIFSTFTGASRQGLSHKELGFIRVPLPRVQVQRKIVDAIEQRDLKQFALRRCIEQQIATLTAYRKSLIHECVTGQRRVTEADVVRAQNRCDHQA
jgi:type I restriction enzyme S subunit